jgi:dTDP-4-amino-4,6-dideoxygalactose transaminase
MKNITDIEIAREYKLVEKFENEVATFCNSPYAIAVDCCTNALFLAFVYNKIKKVILPKRTYIGVYFAAKNAGCDISFRDIRWEELYRIPHTIIYDSACLLDKNMYIKSSTMCISFSYKKRLKIGRGGVILTDNQDFKNWCCLARNLNKDTTKNILEQSYKNVGWNMLMHPDLAKKGSRLLCNLPAYTKVSYKSYPDISLQINSTLKSR